jgi:hypothetical protein
MPSGRIWRVAVLLALAAGLCGVRMLWAQTDRLKEFRLKRQEVFEFADPPAVEGTGDSVRITFAAKGRCDVTVAIEDVEGRIVRHLASGVLGADAPEPLQPNSLRQVLTWDGKDDQGRYLDDRSALRVRVALGLRARFERSLYWEPKRRISRERPLIAATPEGVYVYEGFGFDHLRLFDHEGEYVRTVYPFPADRIGRTKGLLWHVYPQDGRRLPLKINFPQSTMLTSGRAGSPITYRDGRYKSHVGTDYHVIMNGTNATVMAVRNGRIALAQYRLNRLATDGTTGGRPLAGPRVCFPIRQRGNVQRGRMDEVVPRTAALSPDGRWLYLAGYVYGHRYKASADIVGIRKYESFPMVLRVDMDADAEPQLLLGSRDSSQQGSGAGRFKSITSLSCDPAGRLYVADYANDRVQIYSPAGEHLKTLDVSQPAHVVCHQRTGEVFVFNYPVMTEHDVQFAEPVLRRFAPFGDLKLRATYKLPEIVRRHGRYRISGFPYLAEVDSWREPLTVWIANDWALENVLTRGRIRRSGIRMLEARDGRLVLKRDFARETAKRIVKMSPPPNFRQRLYVHPVTGMLYLSEADAGVGKSTHTLIEIDPQTDRARPVALPFDAEDMAFGPKGLAYLRTADTVTRYDPKTWREVPWDYGEELRKVGFSSSRDGRRADVDSGLTLPSNAFWHHGGISVSPRGHMAVCTYYESDPAKRTDVAAVYLGKPYEPRNYPGRMPSSGRGGGIIHVYDRHGQLLHEDAVPGLGDINGLEIDRRDSLYLLSAATRILGGQRYFNDMTGTVMKFRPKRGRILAVSRHVSLPIPEADRPKRPPDLVSAPQGTAWVEGAEWMYGGVGWGGKNTGTGCACWNTRFCMDYFARSFAPEIDRYSVAVLDAGGNLILRIGRYGNVDSAGPDSLVPLGGDEVGLMYGAYLAVHTDRHLFIADPGNARIVSVKLDYHAGRTVPLGATSDEARRRGRAAQED